MYIHEPSVIDHQQRIWDPPGWREGSDLVLCQICSLFADASTNDEYDCKNLLPLTDASLVEQLTT